MRSNTFKEARTSIYIFAIIIACCILFYLVASMFTSMGYKDYHASVNNEQLNNFTVIIDPGHGGKDPGASENGIIEKDFNLELSLLLAENLRDCGYSVVLTREEDVLLYDESVSGSKKKQDLKNRVDIANKYENSCFISIHVNKFPAEYCKGLQTFYSANNDNSRIFAEKVQSNVKLLQIDNDRRIKDGTKTIYVLENLKMPAILVECGFLSNAEEANLLSNAEYKAQLAFSIYCGISTYLECINED